MPEWPRRNLRGAKLARKPHRPEVPLPPRQRTRVSAFGNALNACVLLKLCRVLGPTGSCLVGLCPPALGACSRDPKLDAA
eukprot:809836-Pyramimonas_sp.AAC.1